MKKTDVLKKIVLAIVTLIALNGLFLLFMTLTYKIPTRTKIKDNVGTSLETLQFEQHSPYINNTKILWNDFDSDLVWINMATIQADDALEAAIMLPLKRAVTYNEDTPETYQDLINALYLPDDEDRTSNDSYSRYWMLIVGFLRILFYFEEFTNIRILVYYINIILLLWLIYRVTKLLGWRGFLPLTTAMALRMWSMHTMNLCTMPDILLSAALMIMISYFYDKEWFKKYGFILYVIQGAFSFATGPLVAPLLTLGMPLILQIVLCKKKDNKLSSWIEIIVESIWWVVGYAGTMTIKSMLSLLVSGSQTGSSQVLYYLGIGQGLKIRFYRIWYCIEGVLSPMEIKGTMFLILLIILFVYMIKKGACKFQSSLQILLITLYPCAWAFIIVEHSIHYFVANIFSIFIYGILTLIVFHIKDNNVSRDEKGLM